MQNKLLPQAESLDRSVGRHTQIGNESDSLRNRARREHGFDRNFDPNGGFRCCPICGWETLAAIACRRWTSFTGLGAVSATVPARPSGSDRARTTWRARPRHTRPLCTVGRWRPNTRNSTIATAALARAGTQGGSATRVRLHRRIAVRHQCAAHLLISINPAPAFHTNPNMPLHLHGFAVGKFTIQPRNESS